MSESVAKNTAYLTVASILQKAIAFGYFLLVARFLPSEQTGIYFLALSIITIVSVVAQFGFPSVVVREVARAPQNEASRHVSRALAVTMPLIVCALVVANLLAWVFGYGEEVRLLVLIGGGVIAADALSLLFFAVLRGMHRLAYEAFGVLIGQTLTVGFGVGILMIKPSLSALMVALLVGSVFNALYSAFWVAKRLGKQALIPTFGSFKEVKTLFRITLPFTIAAVAVKVYSYVDSLFLGKFIGPEAVATYGVAYKFTYAFQFLPLAFVASLYPTFSAQLHRKDKQVQEVFLRSMWYMAILSVPITLGIWVISDELIALTGGQYTASASVLRLLIFALVPIFLDFPIGSLLNAADKQATKTTILVMTMVLNVVLNAIFVPLFGPHGAALAGLVSFIFLFLAGTTQIKKILPDFHFHELWKRLFPIFVSGAGMLGVALLCKGQGSWIYAVIGGSISYTAFLFLFKALKVDDLQQLLTLLRHKKPTI